MQKASATMQEMKWEQISPEAYQCVQEFGRLRCEARVHQSGNGKWMHNVVLRDMGGTPEPATGRCSAKTLAFFLSEQKPSCGQAKQAAELQWAKLVQRHIPGGG